MSVFLMLLSRLIPLYIIMFLGFISGKYFEVKKESIATLLIYVIAPVVVFNGVMRAQLSVSVLTLPILFFLVASILCAVAHVVARRFWKGAEKNILAFAAGSGNVGYFGLPVAIAVFDQEVHSLVVLCILGMILYESTVGFYITARGNFSAAESFAKVLRLPSLYAFLGGIVLNTLGIHLGQAYTDAVLNFQGAYSVLGMMLIGLGIASMQKLKFDKAFTAFTFIFRFGVWPAVMASIVFVDSRFFHLYTPTVHNVLVLMSIVPLAANSVAYATELRAHPEKAAVAVLFSTLFALFVIPLVAVVLHWSV